MAPTAELAEFVFNLKYSHLSDEVEEKLKLCVIDSLANIIGAQKLASAERVLSYVRRMGDSLEASVIGTALKTSRLFSAFAHGTLFNTLGAGDGFNAGGNHPGGTVLPVIYALLEGGSYTGEDVLCAVAAGYEVSCRIASGVYPSHAVKGFNTTGTMGTIAAAVTGAKLLGLKCEEIQNAMGIAGFMMPLTPYKTINQGYTISPLNCGNSARVGLEAAYLTHQGFTGDPFVLEGRDNPGLCALTSEDPDFHKMTGGLGTQFVCQEVYLKPYPAVRPAHGPVDALLAILQKNDLSARDVTKVIVRTYKTATRFQKKTDIRCTPFACRMSIPYVLAAALLAGDMGPLQFENDMIRNPLVHELAHKIEVIEKEEYTRNYPRKTACDVEVFAGEDCCYCQTLEYAKGDAGNPFTQDDVFLKFDKLVSPLIDQERRHEIISQVMHIERLADMQPFIDAVYPQVDGPPNPTHPFNEAVNVSKVDI